MERSQDVQKKNPEIPESLNPVQDKGRPGYKHTPLGWIPEEWDYYRINDVAEKSKGAIKIGPFGSQLKKEDFIQEGIKVYDQETAFSNDFYRGYNYISKEKYESLKSCTINPGDIIVSMMGTIGAAAIVPKFAPLGILNSHLLRIKPNSEIITDEYLRLSFSESPITRLELKKKSHGGIMSGLSAEIVKSIVIAIPPLPEQRRIATILSTWDEAITKTQQLIAQLQQRNKGLMQQLLTGKKKLKGFERTKWNKINADIIFKSVSIKNNDDEQLLSATQDRGIIPRDMLSGRVTMPSGETKSYKLVEPGNFIISLRSFQGGLEYSEYRGIVSPAYTVLKPIKPIDDSFYKYYFKSFDFIGHLAVAVIGIRDGKQISFDDFCVLRLPYPPIEEQKQIAAILSYADKEVKLHEQKLGILQQQKKGLMQKLLTGEVRVKIDNN